MGFPCCKDKPCDIAEVRLDQIGLQKDWLAGCREIQRSGTPVILTLRAGYEGGQWRGRDEERLALLQKALGEVAAVDVELKSGLGPKLMGIAQEREAAIIVSFHDFDKTPPLEELSGIAEEASREGSVVKVSTMITQETDLETLRKLMLGDWGVPVCVLGMGALGTQTRLSFPALGSCLTYGYLDHAVAPGQLPARQIVDHLRKLIPAYDAEWAGLHRPG